MIVVHNPSRWVVVRITRAVQQSKYIYNAVDAAPPPVDPPPGTKGLVFSDPANSGYVAVIGA